jgi:prepilin-type N-terminal cleavage/methylation domain-containing protein
MRTRKQYTSKGFTIVELLIVIVVIAILAAITIVAYNGITNRAKSSAVQTAVSQAAKKAIAYSVTNAGDYPLDLTEAQVAEPSNVTYLYNRVTTANPKSFCVTATSGTISFYASSTNPTPQQGACPGQTNLVAWDKTQAEATKPILTSASVDYGVFRKTTASMRINPTSPGQTVRGAPYAVSEGEAYTISMWMKSDANWNGQNTNSKIRFGNNSNGNHLYSCPINGVKLDWTQMTCEYTVPAGVTSLVMSVGNDGTTGSIWIDDISLIKS